MDTSLNIKNLNVAELLKLRSDVDKALQNHRAELESQLARLGGGSPRRGGPPSRSHALAGKKVAPKYRSLANPENQWTGRGGTPRWLVDEMKSTKRKKEAFLIM